MHLDRENTFGSGLLECCMSFEVEMKFRVVSPTDMREALERGGCVWGGVVEQEDHYLAHPARDFRLSDEALRIRRCDAALHVTYKGPRLDKRTKTRHEIELPIGGSLAEVTALFEQLGFRAVRSVVKRRTPGEITWGGHAVHVAWDDVVGLGTFLELELLAAADALEQAQECVLGLAAALNLTESEPRSYLQMLIEQVNPSAT
jgi:adenylate cyclase class 2